MRLPPGPTRQATARPTACAASTASSRNSAARYTADPTAAQQTRILVVGGTRTLGLDTATTPPIATTWTASTLIAPAIVQGANAATGTSAATPAIQTAALVGPKAATSTAASSGAWNPTRFIGDMASPASLAGRSISGRAAITPTARTTATSSHRHARSATAINTASD